MFRMTTIKVKTSTRDGVRALAERQGVTIDVAIRRMTALVDRGPVLLSRVPRPFALCCTPGRVEALV